MSQYNQHPFTYDEDGKLHQLSNAKKAPTNATGFLTIRFDNGLLCIRPKTKISENQLSAIINPSTENYLLQYEPNAYLVVLGHMIDALNLRTHVEAIRNRHHSLFNGRLDAQTLLTNLLNYYKQRFEVKAFPVGAKVFVLDLESEDLYSLAPDCEINVSRCFLEGNFAKDDAIRLLSSLEILNDSQSAIDQLKLKTLSEDQLQMLQRDHSDYRIVFKCKE